MPVFAVLHSAHRAEDKGLVLLPISPNSSRNLQNIRKGDRIVFEYETEEREVLMVAKVNLKSTMAEFLCKYIYNYPLSVIMRRWENNAIAMGDGRGSIDRDYCMVIYYKKNEELAATHT